MKKSLKTLFNKTNRTYTTNHACKLPEENYEQLNLFVESSQDLNSALYKVCVDTENNNDQISSEISKMTVNITHQNTYLDEVKSSLHTVYEQVEETSQVAKTTTDVTSEAYTNLNSTANVHMTNLLNDMANMKTSFESMLLIIQELLSTNATLFTAINAIKDISSQTKLLAVNAKIEAARAGDSGRGFSVVADQVQYLSDCSNNASQDIEEQLHSCEKISLKVQEVLQLNTQNFQSISDAVGNTSDVFINTLTALTEVTRQMQILEEQTKVNNSAIKDIVDKVNIVAEKSHLNTLNANEICRVSMNQSNSIYKCVNFAEQTSFISSKIQHLLNDSTSK